MTKLRSVVRGLWIVLVIVPVAAVGTLVIYRFHGIFGADPLASAPAGGGEIVSTVPKYVTYEVYGPEGTTGMVSYVDERAESREAQFTSLPWTLTLTTTVPSVFANIVAQGDSHEIGCRITVNGDLRVQQQGTGHDAAAFCVVKAA
ncbi:transport acessory protein MmpS [Mycobacterium sp. M1]|uniref:Transport acessory protein MmpS n=1 Tax=Mycolicibacter acidiphilus TaxID=2835306 RepID=A0ABS5RHF0_9MYCO|nr:transport acessory protein MmpS [Mycolicibacter acidiphilus]